MAFSKNERRELITAIVNDDDKLEGKEDWLETLTDNQLIAIQQPEELDNAIDPGEVG